MKISPKPRSGDAAFSCENEKWSFSGALSLSHERVSNLLKKYRLEFNQEWLESGEYQLFRSPWQQFVKSVNLLELDEIEINKPDLIKLE